MHVSWKAPLKRSAGLVAVILAIPVCQAAVDEPGSSDHAFFERYPLSYIDHYEQRIEPQYRLALGPIKKIDYVVAPEKDQYLSGVLTRITYRIPDGRSSDEVIGYVNRQLEKTPHEILYRCEARDCGSSNDWANVQFGIPQLYGLDREQFYIAAKLQQPAEAYLVFYTVKRANRRVYLQLDVLTPTASKKQTPAEIIAKLSKSERVYVEAKASDADINALSQALQTLLNESSYRQIWLVGHQRGGKPFASLKNDSQLMAQELRSKLIQLGLPASKLKTEGVGGFAPSYQRDVPENRIEVVIE